MTLRAAQRGSLLIIAVVMIVVVGFLSSVVAYLAVGQLSAGTDNNSSVEALYLAESGLERGVRQWLQNPSTYTGEGPVTLGGGAFTITVRTDDATGTALPANQRRIISVGQAASAARTTEAIVQLGGGGFTEPFPDINNWLTAGPSGDKFYTGCSLTGANITAPTNGGTVSFVATDNAPGSTGGAFRAQLSTAATRDRLGGYRQRTLTPALASGGSITLDFWYKKIRGSRPLSNMMMAIDLAATDNTVYRLWSNCTVGNIAWTAASVNWTVPAGKTIDRIRLGYHIRDQGKGAAATAAAALFDHIVLTAPGSGATGVVSSQDVIP